MLNIWIVQAGEPLPIDGANQRLFRSGALAMFLAENHQVTWWASRFNHFDKKQRSGDAQQTLCGGRLRLRLLDSSGYTRNVSVSRYLDHKQLARALRKSIAHEKAPDVIYVALPINDLAAVMVDFAVERNIPITIDIRDLWPDVIIQHMPWLLRPFMRALFAHDQISLRRLLRRATAITGHAPYFVEWGLMHAGRAQGAFDKHFFFGYPAVRINEEDAQTAYKRWGSLGVDFSKPNKILCYFGNFGARAAIDIDTLVEAAAILEKTPDAPLFVLCGDGPKRGDLERKRGANVLFPGWVDMIMISVLMRHASFGLLPYMPTIDFANSIPNKAIEYLSHGLPVVTSLTHGILHDILVENECGLFYKAKEPRGLASVLSAALGQTCDRDRMSNNAKTLYESKFRADQCTHSMAEYLVDLGSRH